MANNWDEFFATPIKASKKLHVTAKDVKRGAQIDSRRREAERQIAEQNRTTPTGLPYGVTPRPSGVPSDAPSLYAGELTKSAPPELVGNALLAGNLGGLSAAFGALAPLRAGLAVGAGSDAVLNAGEGGELPAAMAGAGVLGRRALPVALATGAAYAADAEAGSKYDPRAFLRYIQQNFPDMLSSAKQGMKFTADTGREAGVYGLLDDSMRIKPRMIIHGSTNSVPMPRDLRRELVDSANAFDMHTHPNDNALPSTPLNNAEQNPLGGDTQYYQSTGRGVPWKRPGRADNFIVSVQPRAIREPLDFGNGRGESWTHMKMNEYPDKQELKSLDDYLVNNADRYENMLPMGDIGMMIPDDLNTFALLKHYADTGRGDFTYNLGKEVFGPGGREPATPVYEAIYEQLRKDKHLRNYAGGGLVKSGLKMMFPNLGAPLHVVKPKGGNWLSGTVEDALSGLRYEAPPIKGATRTAPETYNNGASERVVWKAPDGSVVQVNEGPAGHFTRADTLDNWIEGPLTKYVKTRMASPEDEVRKLADQGILHIDQDSLRNSIRTQPAVIKERVDAGFPEGGMSPLKPGERTAGYDWENASDSFITSGKAGSYANTNTFGGKNPGPTYLRDNPWLATAPPETPIYGFATRSTGSPQLAPSLGFDHLVDELSNALDPNSGLPRHLALTPEAVKNLSMEKAVRRVADINAWRAAQIAEANGKIAGGPGQELVREYAHSPEKPNPKGLRWVELKKQTGDKLSDEQLVKAMEERGMYPEEIETALKDPKQRAQIEEQAFSDVGALANQLRYEGDTMGHCVGGYCDDVISGRSRIFSLRDAKGEPHVTIEVAPFGAKNTADNDELYEMAEEQVLKKLGDFKHPDFKRMLEERYNELVSEPQGYRIEQIKGKQNRKPNDEYLPFVQDFVKNPPHGQPWDEVGDLQNTGLRRTIDAFNSNELKKIQEAGIEVPTHATPEEIEAINRQIWPDPDVRAGAHPEGFASGGSVGVPAAGWELLTDPTGSPTENKLSWDIFSGHNDAEQLEALE